MELTQLKRQLTASEIDFRVGMATKTAKGAWVTLLAYKDARVDMNILDEVVGQEKWQVEYKRDSKGVLQCGIGVKTGENGTSEWVWKWSNGIESNTEKEKGEYSDAFKRAGFMWGIGRHLYDFPQIWVQLGEDEFYMQDTKVKVSNKFRPNDWKWEISETRVIAIDKKGVERVKLINK